MRIGILTFHRAHNYGAVLQCYALQEVLKGMGHEVEVIDYRQPQIERAYDHWSFKTLIKCCIKFWRLRGYIAQLMREHHKRQIFDAFKDNFLNVRYRCDSSNIPIGYDVYVVGSDQLFTTEITGGLDPVFSGLFKRNESSKLIGYAISSNIKAIRDIGAMRWKQIKAYFDAISLREKTLADKIHEWYNVPFEVCLDPTILTVAETWDKMSEASNMEDDYIVMYEVRRLPNDRNMLNRKAKELALKHKLRVIDLSSMRSPVNEWVNYIRNAKCVVTTSFHATVFALIFERPIYSFRLDDGRDYRYTDILEYVGLSHCIKSVTDILTEIPDIDYDKIRRALQEYQKQSMDFLYSNIQ